MKRYVVFGFDDYIGTDLEFCIQGTSDHIKGSETLAGNHDTIQILDTHSGAILTWTGKAWAKEGNAE